MKITIMNKKEIRTVTALSRDIFEMRVWRDNMRQAIERKDWSEVQTLERKYGNN